MGAMADGRNEVKLEEEIVIFKRLKLEDIPETHTNAGLVIQKAPTMIEVAVGNKGERKKMTGVESEQREELIKRREEIK